MQILSDMSLGRYTGVAPEATILSYKVFSESGDVSDCENPSYSMSTILMRQKRELWTTTL